MTNNTPQTTISSLTILVNDGVNWVTCAATVPKYLNAVTIATTAYTSTHELQDVIARVGYDKALSAIQYVLEIERLAADSEVVADAKKRLDVAVKLVKE